MHNSRAVLRRKSNFHALVLWFIFNLIKFGLIEDLTRTEDKTGVKEIFLQKIFDTVLSAFPQLLRNSNFFQLNQWMDFGEAGLRGLRAQSHVIKAQGEDPASAIHQDLQMVEGIARVQRRIQRSA